MLLKVQHSIKQILLATVMPCCFRELQAAVVRGAAIGALTRLFQDPSNIASLHDFVGRFERRCIELVEDVDERIAVKAVGRGNPCKTLDCHSAGFG